MQDFVGDSHDRMPSKVRLFCS
jgi:hypothetical protein